MRSSNFSLLHNFWPKCHSNEIFTSKSSVWSPQLENSKKFFRLDHFLTSKFSNFYSVPYLCLSFSGLLSPFFLIILVPLSLFFSHPPYSSLYGGGGGRKPAFLPPPTRVLYPVIAYFKGKAIYCSIPVGGWRRLSPSSPPHPAALGRGGGRAQELPPLLLYAFCLMNEPCVMFWSGAGAYSYLMYCIQT